jgi:hypothetical protein
MERVLWNIRLVLSALNLGILLILISMLSIKVRKIRSKHTIGFLIFAVALLLRTFFASPYLKILLGIHFASGIDVYRVYADLFELFALLIFLYISTR